MDESGCLSHENAGVAKHSRWTFEGTASSCVDVRLANMPCPASSPFCLPLKMQDLVDAMRNLSGSGLHENDSGLLGDDECEEEKNSMFELGGPVGMHRHGGLDTPGEDEEAQQGGLEAWGGQQALGGQDADEEGDDAQVSRRVKSAALNKHQTEYSLNTRFLAARSFIIRGQRR